VRAGKESHYKSPSTLKNNRLINVTLKFVRIPVVVVKKKVSFKIFWLCL